MTYFDVDWSERFNFGQPRSLSALRGVCIHTTENRPGTPAENVANYQITSETGSYHVLVDSIGKRLRENTDDWQTWSVGNKGNDILLHISFVFYAAASRQQWLAQEKMLRAGASVVAHWLRTYGWPNRWVDTNGLPGITTHNAVRAWGGTDHTDPGVNFPHDVFTQYVQAALGNLNTSDQKGTDMTVPFNRTHEAALNDTKIAAIDSRAQLTGSSTPGQYPGWVQLGGRTVVDALAAIGTKLGIEGFRDPKAGK